MLKRILFDNQIFRRQPYGGISKYFTELLTGIKNYPEFEILPEKFYSDNVNLVINNLTRFNEFRSIIDFPGKPIIEKVIYRWEIIKTRDRLKKGDFDIFHPTYYIPYFASALPANKKLVLTVHDMIHENYYNHLYEHIIEDAAWKQTLIPRADHIITVSQFTKNQVLKFFPEIDESRISVIHHGIRPYAGKSNKQLDLPEKYILYVGIRKHYKKFPWLAEALGDYIKKNGITLLCAGAKDFDPYEKEMLDRWNLGEQVKYFAIEHENDFATLYSNALCFVFPSIEEGFGIPILEAFVNNCPVLLSDSSCFPEVGGDAALYFEPYNKQDLIDKLDTIINNKNTGDSLRTKGKQRAKLFTWERTVAEHIKVYNALLD